MRFLPFLLLAGLLTGCLVAVPTGPELNTALSSGTETTIEGLRVALHDVYEKDGAIALDIELENVSNSRIHLTDLLVKLEGEGCGIEELDRIKSDEIIDDLSPRRKRRGVLFFPLQCNSKLYLSLSPAISNFPEIEILR